MTLGTNLVGELYYNPGQTNSFKLALKINCIERYFNVLAYFNLKQGQNYGNEIQHDAENIKYRLARQYIP